MPLRARLDRWLVTTSVAPNDAHLLERSRFSGVAGIYQRHRYAREVREAFELWSQYIEALTSKKAAAAQWYFLV
jgi:hypothetical protein